MVLPVHRAHVTQVKVRKFTLKAGMGSENNAYEYSFSLWGSLTGYSQPVRLEKCVEALTSLLRNVGVAVLRDWLDIIESRCFICIILLPLRSKKPLKPLRRLNPLR